MQIKYTIPFIPSVWLNQCLWRLCLDHSRIMRLILISTSAVLNHLKKNKTKKQTTTTKKKQSIQRNPSCFGPYWPLYFPLHARLPVRDKTQAWSQSKVALGVGVLWGGMGTSTPHPFPPLSHKKMMQAGERPGYRLSALNDCGQRKTHGHNLAPKSR